MKNQNNHISTFQSFITSIKSRYFEEARSLFSRISTIEELQEQFNEFYNDPANASLICDFKTYESDYNESIHNDFYNSDNDEIPNDYESKNNKYFYDDDENDDNNYNGPIFIPYIPHNNNYDIYMDDIYSDIHSLFI